MQIDPTGLSPKEMHKIMIGSVIPRPIAWITSTNPSGTTNCAPFSFFNGVCAKPATISVSFSFNPDREDHKKDTLRNIERTGDFVINVVSEPHQQVMHNSSANVPLDESEIEALGLETLPSSVVKPPRLVVSPIHMECTLHQLIPVGDGPGSATLMLGRVHLIHIDDRLIDNANHIDQQGVQAIGRMAGSSYCFVREIFDLGVRP
ncbi:MAG: flavin reductase family protein [Spirochaetaceae bacterium]|nr:MAG: flavin reductase family protein [Spirochaetaceae bacterium]